MPLTPLQARFCEEYIIDLNATQAAKRAGSKATTEPSLANVAHAMLKKIEVIERIAQLTKERSEKTQINATWLLERLVAEADADFADLYDENGAMKPIAEWPKVWRQGLVQGLDTEELFDGNGKDRERIGSVRKVKIGDRLKRLELIGRHVGVQAFRENVGLSGPDGGPVQVEDVNDRARLAAVALMIARGQLALPAPDADDDGDD